jgi:uncharacterized damage-inducible protein DinB
MSARIPGFKGEYLWEFDIAEKQLLLLADTFPPEQYGWRAGGTARSVSEVLVHVATGHFMLLAIVGVEAAPDLYGKLSDDLRTRMMAIIGTNDSLAKNVTDKAQVIALFRKALDATRRAATETPDSEMDLPAFLFGEETTVRRVFMRALSHMHEHMGQLTGYMRSMGLPAPWPDWRQGAKHLERGA